MAEAVALFNAIAAVFAAGATAMAVAMGGRIKRAEQQVSDFKETIAELRKEIREQGRKMETAEDDLRDELQKMAIANARRGHQSEPR